MFIWVFVSIIGLLAIAIEDITRRSVYFFWFIIAFIGALGFIISSSGTSILFSTILTNMVICLFVALLTIGFYFLKHKQNCINFLQNSIGLGDLIILPVIIISFSPINFILFCISTIIITLIGYNFYQLSKNKEVTIPLAGFWSLGLIISIILSIFNVIDAHNDDWVYLWLMN